MKFIFPKNYDFNTKILGIIDYSTAILNVVWFLFVFLLVFILPVEITIKIVVFISLAFPIFLFSITGFNGENIVYVLCYLLKYLFRQKLFFFLK